MAARIGQVGVYLLTLLRNPSAGAVQPVKQVAGLANSELYHFGPTMGTSSAVVKQTVSPASYGPKPNTNGVPAGLERPTQEVFTVQKPVETKLQPTQPTFVRGCSREHS